jgi:uncharacterized protein YcfL
MKHVIALLFILILSAACTSQPTAQSQELQTVVLQSPHTEIPQTPTCAISQDNVEYDSLTWIEMNREEFPHLTRLCGTSDVKPSDMSGVQYQTLQIYGDTFK